MFSAYHGLGDLALQEVVARLAAARGAASRVYFRFLHFELFLTQFSWCF